MPMIFKDLSKIFSKILNETSDQLKSLWVSEVVFESELQCTESVLKDSQKYVSIAENSEKNDYVYWMCYYFDQNYQKYNESILLHCGMYLYGNSNGMHHSYHSIYVGI